MPKKYDTFISFQHDDVMQARGLRLLNANPNHQVAFRERSFIDPIKGKPDAHVWNAITSEIDQSAVVLVLVGNNTHKSNWVPEEVQYAIDKGIPVTAQTLPGKDEAVIPACLKENNVPVEKWNPQSLNEQISRAVKEGKAAQGNKAAPKTGGGC